MTTNLTAEDEDFLFRPKACALCLALIIPHVVFCWHILVMNFIRVSFICSDHDSTELVTHSRAKLHSHRTVLFMLCGHRTVAQCLDSSDFGSKSKVNTSRTHSEQQFLFALNYTRRKLIRLMLAGFISQSGCSAQKTHCTGGIKTSVTTTPQIMHQFCSDNRSVMGVCHLLLIRSMRERQRRLRSKSRH